MDRELQIEQLAEVIWNYYYPEGGSVFKRYADLDERDKILHRVEARGVASMLDGSKARCVGDSDFAMVMRGRG